MNRHSGQKFLGRNRAPRVHIEYEVQIGDGSAKRQLPFVTGVLADLSGSPHEALVPVADRSVMEIDNDNFDDRMKSVRPRVAFRVPNRLTGEGELSVDLEFESMEDFGPAGVARRVPALNRLLTMREELGNLLALMDGKANAEELIGQLLEDPRLLSRVAEGANREADRGLLSTSAEGEAGTR